MDRYPQADGKAAPDPSMLEASLDLRVLSTVLELTKGQKLLSRCLAMLPPGQRSALVPSILALTLARAPAATLRNAPSEQVGVLRKLTGNGMLLRKDLVCDTAPRRLGLKYDLS